MNNVFNNKYTYIICILLAIIVAFSVVFFEKKNKSESIVRIDGEFANEYPTVEALKQDSELILEVTANSVNTLKYEGLVFSIADSNVKKVYKGSVPGNTVKILETGGTFEGKEYIFEDSPVFKVNESAIVFLKKYSGPVASDAYYVTGSIQGKFRMAGGKLKPPHFAPGELASVRDLNNLKLN
ncbi:hypothetical protein HQN90_26540 [Paenibacillus alba]|uniref:hypothetical protein n=1 Tax=Paenibacillus alba TaxID=1197127 RepID=UPI0015634D1C|nr:hypothetical protein [Paenibacillus alba]NQX69696.1 hypothetical protein [Paenibacillus alba]